MLTLSSMSFHCFCHRVSGAIITLPPLLVASLRRESSYARVAEAVVFSGNMAAATCAESQQFRSTNQLSLADAGMRRRLRGRWCSMAVPLSLPPGSHSAAGEKPCIVTEHRHTERWLSQCALSH